MFHMKPDDRNRVALRAIVVFHMKHAQPLAVMDYRT